MTFLPARQPFELGEIVEHLAARAVPGVEEVVDGEYRRAVRLAHGPAVVGLSSAPGGVRMRLWGADPRDAGEAARRAAAALDLDRDPATVVEALGDDGLIGPLVRTAPGRRVPSSLEPEEMAIRAVIGQQVSLAGAATVTGRIAAELGDELPVPVGSITHAFPVPATLAAAEPASLPMPRSRGRAIVAVAAALANGEVDLRGDPDPALLAIPGVGPWTVSVIRLRALGDRDAFPATDLGLRRAFERLGIEPGNALALAERWRPLRAYAAQHLWAAV